MKPRRYQLRKEAVGVVRRGHPWIFRDQLSSAAGVFADGQWLRLVDGDNRVIAHGFYEADGAIAIRVLRRGAEPYDAAHARATLAAAVARRRPIGERTDAIRLVHGESDGIPAVVVDRFGDVLVVASYSPGADALARYVARTLPALGEPLVGAARTMVLRPARRRRGTAEPQRVLRGDAIAIAPIREDGHVYAVDLEAGHKTGTYLDLRGLRRDVAAMPLAGARVLNLFAYTGMLGRAAEVAGAAHIASVDQSARALAFASAHHVIDARKHELVEADVFAWIHTATFAAPFELVIVDPPAMTSQKSQVGAVLAAYKKLYAAAARHVRPGGALVAACCTSRVERAVFHRTVAGALGAEFTRECELPVEIDHPVGFPEADYLKIAIYRRAP